MTKSILGSATTCLPREEEDGGEDEGAPPTEVRQGDGRHEAAEDGAEGGEARCNRGMIRRSMLASK